MDALVAKMERCHQACQRVRVSKPAPPPQRRGVAPAPVAPTAPSPPPPRGIQKDRARCPLPIPVRRGRVSKTEALGATSEVGRTGGGVRDTSPPLPGNEPAAAAVAPQEETADVDGATEVPVLATTAPPPPPPTAAAAPQEEPVDVDKAKEESEPAAELPPPGTKIAAATIKNQVEEAAAAVKKTRVEEDAAAGKKTVEARAAARPSDRPPEPQDDRTRPVQATKNGTNAAQPAPAPSGGANLRPEDVVGSPPPKPAPNPSGDAHLHPDGDARPQRDKSRLSAVPALPTITPPAMSGTSGPTSGPKEIKSGEREWASGPKVKEKPGRQRGDNRTMTSEVGKRGTMGGKRKRTSEVVKVDSEEVASSEVVGPDEVVLQSRMQRAYARLSGLNPAPALSALVARTAY